MQLALFIAITFSAILFAGTKGNEDAKIESCPADSKIIENTCQCNFSSCTKPFCQYTLSMISNGTQIPGKCCPQYECIECPSDSKIEDLCPCAPGATIRNQKCECLDKEKHLVNGTCVCNAEQCSLPALCDSNSAQVYEKGECCKKYQCMPCPHDSYVTNRGSDLLDEMCVCYPCRTQCDYNQSIVIISKGKNIPGHCCDLYKCISHNDLPMKKCKEGTVFQENGHECKCENGLSKCVPKSDEMPKPCWRNNTIYNHNETWIEDRCTQCTCINGENKCISHFCDFDTEEINPLKNVNDIVTPTIATASTNHLLDTKVCPSMENCTKKCEKYRVNRQGCALCKCVPLFPPELLDRYNITKDEIIKAIEEHKKAVENADNLPKVDGKTPTVQNVEQDQFGVVEKIDCSNGVNSEVGFQTPNLVKSHSIIWLSLIISLLVVVAATFFLVKKCYGRRVGSFDISNEYKTVNNNNDHLISSHDEKFGPFSP